MTRRGTSYAELSLVCVLLALVHTLVDGTYARSLAEARDAALRADLSVLRQAVASYALDHHGLAPRGAREVVAYVAASRDPLAWRGSAGHGRIELVDGAPALRDESGGAPEGRDAWGRPYATYR